MFRILFIVLITLANTDFSNAQTYTTTSKSCGKCGKSVSANSKIGDRCPHCGVIWGRENTHTSTSTYSSPSYRSSSNYLNVPNITTKKNTAQKQVKDDDEVDNSTASKSETENWILDKLRTNTPQKYYDNVGSIDGFYSMSPSLGWYNMNYYYSFDTYNLIIQYEQERDKKITKYKIVIPIYDIDRVYDYKGDFWITTKKQTIIEYNLTDNTKRVAGAFTTDFNVYSETDLCKRLHKAFLHLKKFYKKPTSNEPF